jgi:penicillin G amidase
VRVVRDRLDVPHLVGAERLDVYRALGWVMADDRLWQMDLLRRLGAGRVAEVLGGLFLPLDAIARTVGFPNAARKAAERLEGEVAATIGAFADGVSGRIAEGPLPPEFELLGYAPEPWTAVDSLFIEYFIGFALAMESLEPKLFLARALGQLGFERGSWLYPVPLAAGAVDAERLAAYRGIEPTFFEALAALAPPPAGGSNAWAVAPRRAAGGSALVAGDPHLLHTAPSPWYLVHLVAPDLDVAGAAYVGGPLVQVGRNQRGAWSVTNLTADDADLVVERLHPEDPGRYAGAAGEWEPLAVREETIAVRGDVPVRLAVRATRSGPLLDAVAGVMGTAPGVPVALRWKSVVAPGHSAAGWLAVNRSRGLDDVLAAATAFDGAPFASNMVYADADGRLAHLALGAVPRRPGETGMLPALGWRGEGEWEGVGSLGASPWRVDPPEGAVWTANERTGAADRAAGGDGQPFGEHPARARRIRGALLDGGTHSVETFARLQVDDLDLAAVANLPYVREALAGWTTDDPVERQAQETLLAWDGRAAVESAGAALYYVFFYAEWVPTLLPEERSPGLARRWRIATWGAERVLRAPRSPWFADPDAKGAALRGCVAGAVVRLRTLAGDDPSAWRWGDLHRVRFAHALSFAPRFAAGALPAFPVGGGPFSLDQERFGTAEPPFGAVVGAGVRMVCDLADPDHLFITLSTGQAGDPESPHFADQLPSWRAGKLFRLTLDAARVEDGRETILAPASTSA